jgi:hypothetical protein
VPAATAWTCTRCEMTVSFAPEAQDPGLPSTWVKKRGDLYCLSCQREMAGEAGVAALPDDAPEATRQQTKSQARIEFEIQRDPTRPDNLIAKACSTSIVSVRKARERLGLVEERG